MSLFQLQQLNKQPNMEVTFTSIINVLTNYSFDKQQWQRAILPLDL